ncbi:hypothetical protein M3J07_003033 [Ascochyta lentis]
MVGNRRRQRAAGNDDAPGSQQPSPGGDLTDA